MGQASPAVAPSDCPVAKASEAPKVPAQTQDTSRAVKITLVNGRSLSVAVLVDPVMLSRLRNALASS